MDEKVIYLWEYHEYTLILASIKYRYGFNTQEKGDGIAIGNPREGFDGQFCLSSSR